MIVANGNFTIVLSDKPKCFWKGVEVLGVNRLNLQYDEDEVRVKLHVSGTQEELYADMNTNGIIVKKGVRHE